MLLDEMKPGRLRIALENHARIDRARRERLCRHAWRRGGGENPLPAFRRSPAAAGRSRKWARPAPWATRSRKNSRSAVTETRPALVPAHLRRGFARRFSRDRGPSRPRRACPAAGPRSRKQCSSRIAVSRGRRSCRSPPIGRERQPIRIAFLPGDDVWCLALIGQAGEKTAAVRFRPRSATSCPKRLAAHLAETHGWTGPIGEASDRKLAAIAATLQNWEVFPIGTEGYRTAEVTLGGVDTAGLNSRTDGSQGRRRALFHRRGGRCHRLARRLQFPVGVVVRPGRRRTAISERAA